MKKGFYCTRPDTRVTSLNARVAGPDATSFVWTPPMEIRV
jgi:hypothetical protein